NGPPFGPTFDFAISDMSTQTQTFQVIFTGQTSGQLAGQTPFFVPKDARSGQGITATIDNGLPGAGIVYYLPCQGPGSNPYDAPGFPYGPIGVGPNADCFNPPATTDLYKLIPALYTGW